MASFRPWAAAARASSPQHLPHRTSVPPSSSPRCLRACPRQRRPQQRATLVAPSLPAAVAAHQRLLRAAPTPARPSSSRPCLPQRPSSPRGGKFALVPHNGGRSRVKLKFSAPSSPLPSLSSFCGTSLAELFPRDPFG